MNREQYLFKILEEESSEVGQEASKCMRFTPHHKSPIYELTNIQKLQVELTDLFTAVDMIERHLGVTFDKTPCAKKEARIEEYYEISKSLGTVRND